MSSETAETYLRQFAETLLRGRATGTLSFSDCRLRMDVMSAAFESAGVLAAAVTSEISGGLDLALVARGVMALGLRPPRNLARPLPQAAPATAALTSGGTVIVPAGAAFRIGDHGQANGKPAGVPGEQVYLLSYLAAPGRAWLNVAARSSVPPAPRRHASPPSSRAVPPGTTGTSARIARPPTFAGGGLTAADNTGQRYSLSFSGGGGTWYLGRLALTPAPPPGLEWLDVACGEQTVRLDLTTRAPEASITISQREVTPAEAFLLRQAETLLFHPAHARAGTAALTDIVPAFRAIGAIPESSPVPAQIAALCERLGVPAAAIAEPGDLPGRWAAVLVHRDTPSPAAPPADPPDPAFQAAHLVAMLPEADGIAISLGGLITRPGAGTVVFGALEPRSALRAWQERTSMWLADDAGGWHAVTVSGWASTSGGHHTFQADVEPPLEPETTAVEFFVTGPETEVRAALPLTWWIS